MPTSATSLRASADKRYRSAGVTADLTSRNRWALRFAWVLHVRMGLAHPPESMCAQRWARVVTPVGSEFRAIGTSSRSSSRARDRVSVEDRCQQAALASKLRLADLIEPSSTVSEQISEHRRQRKAWLTAVLHTLALPYTRQRNGTRRGDRKWRPRGRAFPSNARRNRTRWTT